MKLMAAAHSGSYGPFWRAPGPPAVIECLEGSLKLSGEPKRALMGTEELPVPRAPVAPVPASLHVCCTAGPWAWPNPALFLRPAAHRHRCYPRTGRSLVGPAGSHRCPASPPTTRAGAGLHADCVVVQECCRNMLHHVGDLNASIDALQSTISTSPARWLPALEAAAARPPTPSAEEPWLGQRRRQRPSPAKLIFMEV